MTKPREKELQGPVWNHLFDVRDPEMEKNIGRKILLKNPKEGEFKKFGFSGDLPHVIGAIQRIYNGRLAYRAYFDEFGFGRPVLPEDIAEWLPEDS